MIWECKGIFCIVFFLFHKAFYLWLCILAISTLPPTSASIHHPSVAKGAEIMPCLYVAQWLGSYR